MISHFFKSFVFAARGVISTFKLGLNFKVMFVIALCAIVLGLVLNISLIEWTMISLCIGLVLGAECLNTALENAVDLFSPDHNKIAARAKDCAAGGVLLLSIASFVIACLIFIPKLVTLVV